MTCVWDRDIIGTEMNKTMKKMGERKMKKVKIIQRGSNLPNCPKCGSGNALLDGREWCKIRKDRKHFECRDCGYLVDKRDVELHLTEMDAPGMGIHTTYHLVRVVTFD